MASATDSERRPLPLRPPPPALGAAILTIVALVLNVAVTSRAGEADPERERDPRAHDEAELRPVVRGVSGVIVATEPETEAARI